MKNFFLFFILSLVLASCGTRVDPGNAGVIVQMSGSDAGKMEVVGPGRYILGFTEELFEYPCFEQTESWNTPITFQTNEGLVVSGTFGATYIVVESRVQSLFEAYRKPLEEVMDLQVRNLIRDGLNRYSSTMTADKIISEKTSLMDSVTLFVNSKTSPHGLNILRVSVIGEFKFPSSVEKALNNKIEATQLAAQRENELAAEEAQGKKKIIQAKNGVLPTYELGSGAQTHFYLPK